MNTKLRGDKTQVRKLGMYRQYLEQRREALEAQNSSYRNALKATSEGFTDKLDCLEAEISGLTATTAKLQQQKGALVNKIREYQGEI